MRGPKPRPIVLTDGQEAILRRMTRCPTNPKWLVQRAEIVLEMAMGANNRQTARRLGLHHSTPRLWRERWLAAADRLHTVEAQSDDKELAALIETVLADRPRPGAPPTFSAEQVVQIIALACEDPQASGRPVACWTPRELADEAVKRGIVESISPMTVSRFLKGG